MKKFILLILLLSFCSTNTSEVIEDSIQISTTNTTSTTSTTILDESDLMFDNFHKWWVEYKLKDSNIYLNSIETEITKNAISKFLIDDRDTETNPYLYYPHKNNPFSRVVIYDLNESYEGEFTVCNKIKGVTGTGLLDEIHPLQENGNYPYLSFHTYTCEDEETTLLFGYPYFQDGKWWIFKSIPKIITEGCEDPCGFSYTHWATKVEFRPIRGSFFDQQTEQIEFLDDFTDTYDEIFYEVPHDVINFAIFYPKINFNQECADLIEEDLLKTIKVNVDDTIDSVENYLDSDDEMSREDMSGFEWLQLTYDVLEINESLYSVIFRWNSYSYGAAHPQDYYFSVNYFINEPEQDIASCRRFNIRDQIGGLYYEERGMDFQSHYYDSIYQQLCYSDTNWLGCDNIYGDEDYPDFAYPYSVFDDVTPVFGVTKIGLFMQFQNYSIGSYAEGAPRIIVPFTIYKMFSNYLNLKWEILDLKCDYLNGVPTVYEPQDEMGRLCETNKEKQSEIKYRKGWEDRLVSYPELTQVEIAYSLLLEEKKFDGDLNITVADVDYICELKTSGTALTAFASENHPLISDNEFYRYQIDVDYNCSTKEEGFDLYGNEEGFLLYGPLFYQDNQWWGFIEYEDDYYEQHDIKYLYAFMAKYVKRVSLGENILPK